MDKEFQTSFIPKKPLAEERTSTRHPVSVLNFIVTIVFIFSIVAAVGTYFYKVTLAKKVDNMNEQLALAKDRFEPALISDMQTLDRRLNASEQILANHIIVSPIFKSLQDLTLKSVSFTKFDYSIGETGTKEITVLMSGKATGYDAIALQSDALSQNKYIKDPVFSNLNLDDKARVTFDLSFIVDPTFVNYQDTLNRIGEPTLPEEMLAPEMTAPDTTVPTVPEGTDIIPNQDPE